jgi:hypothetical protein
MWNVRVSGEDKRNPVKGGEGTEERVGGPVEGGTGPVEGGEAMGKAVVEVWGGSVEKCMCVLDMGGGRSVEGEILWGGREALWSGRSVFGAGRGGPGQGGGGPGNGRNGLG